MEACIVKNKDERIPLPHAKFKYRIKNISKIQLISLSPLNIEGSVWDLMVKPMTYKSPVKQYLEFFLLCEGNNSNTWTCQADVQFTLISNKSAIVSPSRKIHHVFSRENNTSGFENFIRRPDFINPDNGYTENDSITFEVCVSSRDNNTESVGLKVTEAKFRYTFGQISKITEPITSEAFPLFNLSWKIMVKLPKEDLNIPQSLGLFLQCQKNWSLSCNVEAKFQLMTYKKSQEPLIREIKDHFSYKKSISCLKNFILWEDLIDEDKGWIRDDTITIIGYIVLKDFELYDDARSEATFRYTVINLSKMKRRQLSPPCMIRTLPWKIMVTPSTNPFMKEKFQRALEFSVQCNAESTSKTWSCFAVIEIRLLSYKEGQEPFVKKFEYIFSRKDEYRKFTLGPDKCYIKDDSITVEVHIKADPPLGCNWDSKQYTGYVGLNEQSVVCFANPFLQTLYFTNQLRKAIYNLPTGCHNSSTSLAFAMQRLFFSLQCSKKPVSSKKLLKIYEKEDDQFSTEQYCIYRFPRMLLDKLKNKMKGTCWEETVPNLFQGQKTTVIKCTNIDWTSTKVETFYDIQFYIDGKKNIYESFQDYISTRTFKDDKQLFVDGHGLQDAERNVTFQSFPPVLHLHLMRFKYIPTDGSFIKINDRFEFYDEISLDKYLQTEESTNAIYTLHAVLAHDGSNEQIRNRYILFINPTCDGNWYRFNDDVVSQCSKEEAIEQNYGCSYEDINKSVKNYVSAYILVYIRNSELQNVLQKVKKKDMPQEIRDKVRKENKLEAIRKMEKPDASSYITVKVYLEESFEGYQGFGLYNSKCAIYHVFHVDKDLTFHQLLRLLSESLKYPFEQIRVWSICLRINQTRRPAFIELEDEDDHLTSIFGYSKTAHSWSVFVELLSPDSNLSALPPFDEDNYILLFFKLYDPKNKKIRYVGHHYVPIEAKFQELVSILNEKAGFPPGTKLAVYEEVKPTMINKLQYMPEDFVVVFEELIDGDIIVFQKEESDDKMYELPTCQDYFEELFKSYFR